MEQKLKRAKTTGNFFQTNGSISDCGACRRDLAHLLFAQYGLDSDGIVFDHDCVVFECEHFNYEEWMPMIIRRRDNKVKWRLRLEKMKFDWAYEPPMGHAVRRHGCKCCALKTKIPMAVTEDEFDDTLMRIKITVEYCEETGNYELDCAICNRDLFHSLLGNYGSYEPVGLLLSHDCLDLGCANYNFKNVRPRVFQRMVTFAPHRPTVKILEHRRDDLIEID